MTREEAISALEQAELKVGIKWRNGQPEVYISPYLQEAIDFALTKLRPVSREQVEKAWEKCQHSRACGTCKVCVRGRYQQANFCAVCGAPMTDEAVQMAIKRLGALR